MFSLDCNFSVEGLFHNQNKQKGQPGLLKASFITMKYLSTIIILIAAACSPSNHNISNNPANPGVKNDNIIQVKINEEKTVQLPGWVSSGSQMELTLSDTSIATIRKEIVSTYDSTGLRPGDPVLANWMIKGLKRGTTRIKFAKGSPGKNDGANLRLKNLKIEVAD
jgi:predicted secreted protein